MSGPDFAALRGLIRSANRVLSSDVLTAVEEALASHPTAVSQAQLEAARAAGALAVLRDITKYRPVRQAGHPEEETRELDNIDIRQIAERAKVSTFYVWNHDKEPSQ